MGRVARVHAWAWWWARVHPAHATAVLGQRLDSLTDAATVLRHWRKRCGCTCPSCAPPFTPDAVAVVIVAVAGDGGIG